MCIYMLSSLGQCLLGLIPITPLDMLSVCLLLLALVGLVLSAPHKRDFTPSQIAAIKKNLAAGATHR